LYRLLFFKLFFRLILILGCWVAKLVAIGLLYGRPGFKSWPGTPLVIPLMSESD